MFNFFRKKKTDSAEVVNIVNEEPKEQENGSFIIGAGYAATQSAKVSAQQAAKTFAKPDTYVGNRNLYDSSAAKRNAKKILFQENGNVVDPYTGERLVLTMQEAKELYGADWTRHLAESDHVKPLEQIYNETKGNVWNTTDDIKRAANSEENIRVVSRKFNNMKRSHTNQEIVEDRAYRESKGVYLTEEGESQAILDEKTSDLSIKKHLHKSSLHNMADTGHKAGKEGAQNAGVTALTMSGIMNIVAVINGEKDGDEAVADTIRDGGKAAATGYVMGGGLTILSHSLSKSSSEFIQKLVDANVPGKVITAVLVTGETMRKWGNGEITTQQCLIELGDKGLNMATMGYSMAVGQSLIPIPIVGGAIGALVGSILTSGYYNHLIQTLQTKELEHQERLWIIRECRAAADQTRAFRRELEAYLETYFKECRDCFDGALSSMRFAYEAGDADGMIAGANDITRNLGGHIYYNNVEQFKDFLDDNTLDVL